jgi:hypothetical protein
VLDRWYNVPIVHVIRDAAVRRPLPRVANAPRFGGVHADI